jgi:putative peptidoglycan lipid II flippase
MPALTAPEDPETPAAPEPVTDAEAEAEIVAAVETATAGAPASSGSPEDGMPAMPSVAQPGDGRASSASSSSSSSSSSMASATSATSATSASAATSSSSATASATAMSGPSSMRRLGAAALLLTMAVFLSRVIGFLREAFIASRFGAGAETDAFFAAFTIPDWLNYLVAGGTLSISLLPIYARHLAAGDEAAANRALSVVTTVILTLVVALIVVAEVLAAPLSRAFFHDMPADALADCVRYTRILLPAQLCFVAGGLMTATLLARGHFRAAAFAPLLYNAGIILGGVLLADRLGAASLAWGALVGAFVGPFLIPAVAAYRAGARVHVAYALRAPALREWLWLSLPLMVGVSLVTADDWILRYFASGDRGAISHLNYAKRLVAVPIAIAGQAVGQASMPFFARLFAEGRREELAETVVRTVRGAGVLAIVLAGGLVALAVPVTGLLFVRGHFTVDDLDPTARYLVVFAAAVPLWALQALLARAFYAAGNTWLPMLAGTVVTALSLPAYAFAYHHHGATGLAVASGFGILLHTLSVALLLPRLLPEIRGGARALIAALVRAALLAGVAGAAGWGAARAIGELGLHGWHGWLTQCVGGGLVYGAVILIAARALGVPEPGALIAKVTRKLRRRR